MIADFAPPSTDSDQACGSLAWRVVMPSLRHRADRGQRLAAKPERADLQQVLVVELGGGVAIDREREVAMVMPLPSSVMPIRRRPPPSVKMSIRLAPASMAFSTSSLTTLAAARPPRRRRCG
jgi:hypothetical protein